MANPSGSCCCGSKSAKRCPCNPAYPWTQCRVTVSGVTLAGQDECWNTYDHFNKTIWATVTPAPGTGIIGPYFEGIVSSALTGCFDPNGFQFTRYTVKAHGATISCTVDSTGVTVGPNQGLYTAQVRLELTYYFLGLIDPIHNIYKEINLPPFVIYSNPITKVIGCGSSQTFTSAVAPLPGPLGSTINLPGSIEMTFT